MTATPWRRDSLPREECSCQHTLAAHAIDTKAQACSTWGCPCKAFTLAALRWREVRYVSEEIA